MLAIGLVATLIAAPAHAAVIHFQTMLDASIELPVPDIPAGFNPTGSAFGSYNDETNSLYLEVDWQGLTSDLVNGHIHNGTPSGPVFIPLVGLPSSQSGMYQNTFSLNDEQKMTFLNGLAAGQLYVNLHTKINPTGEIRGFLAPVPEPEVAALMGLGLLGVGVARARRRRLL